MPLHIIKLVVGVETIEELVAWRHAHQGDEWKVYTRMTPKLAEEVLEGGSIYRVIKGVIVCRQEILRLDTVGEGQAKRCHMVVSQQLVRVEPTPRRPFQGWRYLKDEDAPRDLEAGSSVEAMPAKLAAELRSLGAW